MSWSCVVSCCCLAAVYAGLAGDADGLVLLVGSCMVSDISVCYDDSERGGTRCGCYACSDALSADGSVGRRSAYPVRLSQVDKIEIAISEIAISVSSYLG